MENTIMSINTENNTVNNAAAPAADPLAELKDRLAKLEAAKPAKEKIFNGRAIARNAIEGTVFAATAVTVAWGTTMLLQKFFGDAVQAAAEQAVSQ